MPNTNEALEDRRARLAADPSLAPHGELSTYNNWGCRCERCRAARRAYDASRAGRDFATPLPDRAARVEEARKRGWDVAEDVI